MRTSMYFKSALQVKSWREPPRARLSEKGKDKL